MSKYCKVTQKRPLSGNKVSHAKNKTKRKFLPNLQQASFWSDKLKRKISMRISTSAIKTINYKGGLDTWLLNAKAIKLNPSLRKLKKTIMGSNVA